MCQEESCLLVYEIAVNEYKYCLLLLCCWANFILRLLVQWLPQQAAPCGKHGAGRSEDPEDLSHGPASTWPLSSIISWLFSGNNRTTAPVALPTEEVLQTLQDLIAYFQPPEDEMQHEDKQNKLRSLKNRQNLFKEEVSPERETDRQTERQRLIGCLIDLLTDWLILYIQSWNIFTAAA